MEEIEIQEIIAENASYFSGLGFDTSVVMSQLPASLPCDLHLVVCIDMSFPPIDLWTTYGNLKYEKIPRTAVLWFERGENFLFISCLLNFDDTSDN